MLLTSWKAGFLLDGHKGTGKSQVAAFMSEHSNSRPDVRTECFEVLNLLAMWARKNGAAGSIAAW